MPSFPYARRPVGSAPAPGPLDLAEIGRSRDGYIVLDRPQSHHHLSGDLLRTVISRTSLRGRPFVAELVDFGAVIGLSTCVATSATDQIIFAQRLGRRGASRFVMNRQAKSCSTAVAIFKRMHDRPDSYLLITAFIGSLPEPEPWDKNATEASRDFWAHHALIWGSCEVIPNTVSSVCPCPTGDF